MSAPSSDGRPSLSSEPSVTSSQTLNSRHSGSYEGNGEGSSAQVGHVASEAVEERDFAHPQQRVRRSGGFLLDSTFPAGPTSRQSRDPAHHGNLKAKRSARQRTENKASPSSSPLSKEVRIANQEGTHGEVKVAKTRKSVHGLGLSSDSEREDVAPRPTIDPNQIVHMALNLSESRRRNLTAGQLLVPQSRHASGLQKDGSFRSQGGGSSLRQYLNEQRRASRNISPTGGKGSPSGLRHMSASMARSGSMSLQGQSLNPSEATLARRDKARAYIELKMEYLRLLELLPPLKPDSTAPGNFIITSNNMPGSPHAQLTRMPSYAGKRYGLGRQYNPLQFVRNRRSRARERKTLDHMPDEFTDVHRVRDWVDRVERETQNPSYRQLNGALLPKFHDDHSPREDTPSKASRPHLGWLFTPEELLADAHWLEQHDNKTVVEDRHGRKLFPPKELQRQDLLSPRLSKEYPEKRRRSWVEGLPRLSMEPATGDESDPNSERGRKRRLLPAFRAESPKKRHGWSGSRPRSGVYTDSSDSDSDSVKHRSRKARRLPDVNDNTGPLELRIREIIEAEAREAQSKSPAIISPDTPDKWGVGYPDITDKPDSRASFELSETANSSAKPDSVKGFKMPPKSRTDTTLAADSVREAGSSFDDPESSPVHPKTSSPIGADIAPPASRDSSMARKSKKTMVADIFRSDDSVKGHRHEHKHDSDSAAVDKKQSSRQTGEEPEGNGLGNAILAAPGAVKSLLTHRKNDSMASLKSPEDEHRKDMKDTREPASAVTRFFKGVKNEGSKVGDLIFRRGHAEDSDTDTESSHISANESDMDNNASNKQERGSRPPAMHTTTGDTTGSANTKKNGRYHLELPSFRPANHNLAEEEGADATDYSEHHITRQARHRVKDRSLRFDNLAPPRMDLRSISATSSPAHSRASSPRHSQDRLNKVLARVGGVGQGGLPVTSLTEPGLTEAPGRQPSTSRPTLDGKRHWSITDDDGNILHRKAAFNVITASEIARIRALFLCSGIKAREIAQEAYTHRHEPPLFLVQAAKTANASLTSVPTKQEHVLAARILVNNLEASTQALHTSAQTFRESTIKDLTSRINTVKAGMEAELFPRVRKNGDEAVRITYEVSGSAPLQVKQITDEIDRMLRVRRRRMRWIRRIGWMLVEWMLLGVMWCLWLTVVVLGFVKRVFGFGWGFLRWLLWI